VREEAETSHLLDYPSKGMEAPVVLFKRFQENLPAI
jgi:hypothetical protein